MRVREEEGLWGEAGAGVGRGWGRGRSWGTGRGAAPGFRLGTTEGGSRAETGGTWVRVGLGLGLRMRL